MTTLRGLLFVCHLAGLVGCTSSSFGGSGKQGASLDSSASSKSGADASDGDGKSLGNNDGALDASDSGANDLGGSDSDVPGADSSDAAEVGRADGDGSNASDDGGDDDDDKPADKDSELDPNGKKTKNDDADDDDETLAKTKYGATITRVLADDSFDLKIEVLVKGKVLNTANLSFEEHGKGESKTAAAVCRANKDTCMRLTFTNTDGSHSGHQETAGVTPCVFVQESGTSATVDVDTNGGEGGGMHQGTCKPNEDDQLVISCPNSKKLQVQACGN